MWVIGTREKTWGVGQHTNNGGIHPRTNVTDLMTDIGSETREGVLLAMSHFLEVSRLRENLMPCTSHLQRGHFFFRLGGARREKVGWCGWHLIHLNPCGCMRLRKQHKWWKRSVATQTYWLVTGTFVLKLYLLPPRHRHYCLFFFLRGCRHSIHLNPCGCARLRTQHKWWKRSLALKTRFLNPHSIANMWSPLHPRMTQKVANSRFSSKMLPSPAPSHDSKRYKLFFWRPSSKYVQKTRISNMVLWRSSQKNVFQTRILKQKNVAAFLSWFTKKIFQNAQSRAKMWPLPLLMNEQW